MPPCTEPQSYSHPWETVMRGSVKGRVRNLTPPVWRPGELTLARVEYRPEARDEPPTAPAWRADNTKSARSITAQTEKRLTKFRPPFCPVEASKSIWSRTLSI